MPDASNPLATVRACAFDAYGTLFDVHSAIRAVAGELPQAQALSDLWRSRQLQYTWLRSLMGRYADFEAVTRDALRFAMQAHGLNDPALEARLLERYFVLDAFPDAREALEALRGGGIRLVILSNGTAAMVGAAARSAGLADLLQGVCSVDEAGIYKPHPAAYTLATDRLGLAAHEVCLVSSNGWDVAGAASFGLRTVWVARGPDPVEALGVGPDARAGSLAEAARLLLEATGAARDA